MPREQSPAFQFYVKEWRSSRKVFRMTFAERGMYLEMLLEQWENMSLPDSPDALAELIGGTVEEWRAAWPALRPNFAERKAPGRQVEREPRIINVKLEQVRTSLRRFRQLRRNAGLKRSNSAKRSVDGTYAPARIQQLTSSASASATASATAKKELTPAASDRLFDEFWTAYPKKTGKDAARKAFARRKVTDELLAQMLAAVETQRQTKQWREDGGRFIPHPATWLNQGRWQDEADHIGPRPVGAVRHWTPDDCPHEDRHFSRAECEHATRMAMFRTGRTA